MESGLELIEGELKLKRGAGDRGWRHYIKDGEQDREIASGEWMDVRLTGGRLGCWLSGCYQAYLTSPFEAWLVIGEFSPHGLRNPGGLAEVLVPPGTTVRVKRLQD